MKADKKKQSENQEMLRRMMYYKEKLQKAAGKEKQHDGH